MLLFWYVRAHSLVADLWVRTVLRARAQGGQTTAEYALVILAAAAVAVVLIVWARSSGKLPAFFDNIIDQVAGSAA